MRIWSLVVTTNLGHHIPVHAPRQCFTNTSLFNFWEIILKYFPFVCGAVVTCKNERQKSRRLILCRFFETCIELNPDFKASGNHALVSVQFLFSLCSKVFCLEITFSVQQSYYILYLNLNFLFSEINWGFELVKKAKPIGNFQSHFVF